MDERDKYDVEMIIKTSVTMMDHAAPYLDLADRLEARGGALDAMAAGAIRDLVATCVAQDAMLERNHQTLTDAIQAGGGLKALQAALLAEGDRP